MAARAVIALVSVADVVATELADHFGVAPVDD